MHTNSNIVYLLAKPNEIMSIYNEPNAIDQ